MKHKWQPTDTQGHYYQCEQCGKEINIYAIDYDDIINEKCKMSNPRRYRQMHPNSINSSERIVHLFTM